METEETNLKREKQLDLETRIHNLRAEGKTYRQIAEIERVSITQISRILNESKQKKHETTASKQAENLDKKIFRMFTEGIPSNIAIARVGNPNLVLQHWESFKKIMRDDFSQAISKVKEYGFYEPGSSGRPLTDALCRIFEVHFELQNKLNELAGEVKALKWNAAKKDEAIGALKTENAELQKLKRFETMTSDEIKRREKTVQKLAKTEWNVKTTLSALSRQIEAARSFLFSLEISTREAVKKYLAEMDSSEIVTLALEAKWPETRRSLLASVLNSH